MFTANDLRLQGPSSANGTGRVEILYRSWWGTICDNSWDIKDAIVACRQLGYKNGVMQPQGALVPRGSGQIWLDSVNCSGSEQNLTSCTHSGWGNNNCSHRQDAGVKCSNSGRIIIIRFLYQFAVRKPHQNTISLFFIAFI